MKRSILFLFLIVGSFAPKFYAQPAKPVEKKPTVVFIHGLWADGSCWSKVIEPLISKGYPVISVQNPTASLEEDVAAANRAIDKAEGDVILVGHSWGGFVISEAGANPKVKALVYVAAFMPDKGETPPILEAKVAPTQLASLAIPKDGYITLSHDGVKKAFAGDLSESEQNLVFAVQQPASENVFKATGNLAAWKTKPVWYIVATEDKAINPDLERMLSKRAHAKETLVKSSHVAMLSHPKEVLTVVLDAATQYNKK